MKIATIKASVSKNRYFILFLVLVAFQLISNSYVIYKDKFPLIHESGTYYDFSIRYYRLFRENYFIRIYNTEIDNKGPLFFLTSLPFYYVLGLSEDSAAMTNMIYLIIGLYASYLIGKEITKTAKGGFFCAFFISFMPQFFSWSRTYYLEFSIMSMLLVSFYFMIKTEFFSDRKYSIAFALSVAAGGLIKPYFIILLSLPLLFCIIKSFGSKKKERSRKITNIALFFAIAIILPLAFYIARISYYFENVADLLLTGASLNKESFYLDALSYLKFFWRFSLINFVYQFFILALVVVFAFSFYVKKSAVRNKKTFIIFLSFISCYLFFSFFFTVKHPHYTTTFAPSIGLLIGLGFFQMSKNKLLNYFAWVCIGIAVLSFVAISFPCEKKPFLFRQPDSDLIFEKDVYGVLFPTTQDWKIADTMLFINRSIIDQNRVYDILLIENMGFFHNYYPVSNLLNLPFKIFLPIACPEGSFSASCDFDYRRQINDAEFVIKMDDSRPFYKSLNAISNSEERYEELKLEFLSSAKDFELIGVFDIPYDMGTKIYKRRGI